MRVIKYLRLEAGLAQGELAAAIGTTQPALSAWENGKGTMPEARQKAALAHLMQRHLKPKTTVLVAPGGLKWVDLSREVYGQVARD